ncbi:phosphate transporter (Pho88) [Coemansia aciculifera]|uniref:Phosphate transporter (Pho88) n=2 Tax=Coemansia TaxID=4863 RepID=A0A9W8GZ40_9FUNG|nr:phosphate transporter (Pho88) [Coemansia pectinata]KAJ2867148.1 phosphate transporter (Pho88) [Coemansia aciculifera]
MAGMQDQLLQMAVIFGTMHIVKRAGLEDPEYAMLIRSTYAVATALMIAFTFYLKSLIQKKNDTTALEYNDPAPGNQGAPRIETTVCRYDLAEIAKLQKSSMFTIAIVAFMHFKFGYIQPLILQTLLPMLNLYKSQLFQIHILGKPAVDSLKRPWTPENPFAALTGGAATNPADVAAIENDSDGAAAASSSAASSPEAPASKNKSKKESRKDK